MMRPMTKYFDSYSFVIEFNRLGVIYSSSNNSHVLSFK